MAEPTRVTCDMYLSPTPGPIVTITLITAYLFESLAARRGSNLENFPAYFDRHRVTTLPCTAANRSMFTSVLSTKYLKYLTYLTSNWKVEKFFFSSFRTQTHAFPFESTPNYKYIYRLMDIFDSILVLNFGFENTAISPDK